MADTPTDGLDVYARSFVPDSLRSVNRLPANIISSESARWIDYDSYIRTFAGSDFLPRETHDTENKYASGDLVTPHELSEVNYRHFFLNLLRGELLARQSECEEKQMFHLALLPAVTVPWPSMYWLEVPGLREGSLRLEVGDEVQLRQLRFDQRGIANNATVPLLVPSFTYPFNPEPALQDQHNATVWMIDRKNELILLRVDMLMYGSMKFNVSFTVQSGRMGAIHRAVTQTNLRLLEDPDDWILSMLFPCQGSMQTSLGTGRFEIKPNDPQLNYEQLKAVNTIVQEDYGNIPFLISGPPGTGKTKTLVELALQLIRKDESAHLLICAPSESATDTLVQRLSQHLKPSSLLRLTAPSRSFGEVPDSIKSFCCVDQDMFSLPSFKQLMRLRIVVTTCQDAEMLLRACVSNSDLALLEQRLFEAIHHGRQSQHPRLHWTALLMDEAAQATEPEALIPLSVVAPPNPSENSSSRLPQFILAGDQYQLGPRTSSKTTALQTSLFERIFQRPLYRDHPLARSKHHHGQIPRLTASMLPLPRPPFANLIRNYRSHPSILATPSSLFYNDTLEPCATSIASLLPWPSWRGRRWPILFTPNDSTETLERDGGGWYNIAEANIALAHASSFLSHGLLSQRDICIMSPFAAQVKYLRSLARAQNLYDINIGPLEAFQGLESRLVILCTTRTRARFLEQDLARGLGVMGEPKRFNVALTRAKEGLVVIGNPDVLGRDAEWRAFLGFCVRNGLWESEDWVARKGEGKEWLTGEERVSRLERMMVRTEENQEPGEMDAVEGRVRRLGVDDGEESEMWRDGVQAERWVGEMDGYPDHGDGDGGNANDGEHQ